MSVPVYDNAPSLPTVSVVLVAYNRASVLPRTIESILVQSYSDFELIISDDCSSDATEQVARHYERLDPRVRYRRNARNLSMPGNLNAGIQSACGQYIANLHDGDIYDSQLLEKWLGALDRCPSAGFVFNSYRQLAPDGTTVRIYGRPLPACVSGAHMLERVFFRAWRFDSPVWGTVMCRRSAYDTVGLFDSRFGFCSDVDMWLRLAGAFDVAYVDEPLIALASKEELPASNPEPFWHQRRLLYQMFREARRRHFADRPARATVELGRHYVFIASYWWYHQVLALRRTVVSRLRGSAPRKGGPATGTP